MTGGKHLNKATLSKYQAIALSSSSYLPVMFWFYPSVAVHYALLDAQWAVLAVVLIGVWVNWMHGKFNDRFPNMTGADPAILLFGKPLGKLIVISYMPVYILFVALSLYFTISLMKYFFPHTPRYILGAAMMLVSWRGAWCGIETLGRTAAIVHPLTFAGIIAAFTAILFQAKHPMIPLTMASPKATAIATYHLLPLYLGVDLILILSPYYAHKNKVSVWYPVYGSIASAIIVLLVFFSIVMNLGWSPVERLAYPVQVVIQLIRMRGFLVERLGIVIIILSVAFTTLFISNHIWGISTTIARIFGQSDHKFKPFTFFTAPCVYTISMIVQSTVEARSLVYNILTPVTWLLVVIIPTVKLVTSYVRNIRTDDREEGPKQIKQPSRRYRRLQRRAKGRV